MRRLICTFVVRLLHKTGFLITRLSFIQVLKALALLRLGRHDDSSVMLQEVHSQHPTDEATLQAMAICYREIHKCKKFEPAHEIMELIT